MQDFKTAFLLGVCPRQQFAAMLIGSSASIFVSVAAYALYTSTYEVPGPKFPAPTAEIWLDMAKLVSVDEVSITYHLWLHQRLCPGTFEATPRYADDTVAGHLPLASAMAVLRITRVPGRRHQHTNDQRNLRSV